MISSDCSKGKESITHSSEHEYRQIGYRVCPECNYKRFDISLLCEEDRDSSDDLLDEDLVICRRCKRSHYIKELTLILYH